MRKNDYKYILKVLTLSFSAVGLELSGSGLTYANDAPPVQSETVELPDQLNTISGALANDADVKHYVFTAVRGQRIIINPTNYSPSRWPWLIEYKIGDTWQTKWGPEPT